MIRSLGVFGRSSRSKSKLSRVRMKALIWALPAPDWGGFRHLDRRAHLARYGLAHLVGAGHVDLEDLVHQVETIGLRRPGPGGESGLRGADRRFRVLRPAQGDGRAGLLGGRIDDLDLRAVDGIDPRTVDVELLCVVHVRFPLIVTRCLCGGVWSLIPRPPDTFAAFCHICRRAAISPRRSVL